MRPLMRSKLSRSLLINVENAALSTEAVPFKRESLFTPVNLTEASANPEKKAFFEAKLKIRKFIFPSTVKLLMPLSVRAFVPLTTTFEPAPAKRALLTKISLALNLMSIGFVAANGVSPICNANSLNWAIPFKLSVVKLPLPFASFW